MLKQILLVSMIGASFMANAQFGKMMKNLENKANGVASEELPKGVELYTETHTDSIGFSGKYYTKYPVKLSVLNAMNMPKYFNVSEVTLELRQSSLSGVFHFLKDEVGKKMRSENTDMKTVVDFGMPGDAGNQLARKTMKACNCFQLEVNNSFGNSGEKRGFEDDAKIYRYTKDPEIIFIGRPQYSEYKKSGKKTFFASMGHNYTGASFNVLSKNKEKLAQWDSLKIVDAIFEMEALYSEETSGALASMINLPAKGVNDAAREKEYFNLIKPFADRDKPAAWGDKFVFCYILKDWKVIYKKDNPTAISHRTAMVIAVSTNWPKGECRYITCTINQPYDGKDFGKAFMAGFNGSLVPVSCESVKGFNK